MSDAYLATLLDCAPDALLVFDERNVIQYVNQQSERLFGYPQSELTRSPLSLLMPSGLSQLPKTSAPLTLQVEARHKAGRRMRVEAALGRTELAEGALYTASCRERSALLQLSAAGQGKADLLGNLSHELRSPLNVIVGFAKLMYRKRVGEVSDAQREYLGDILDSAEHLLELIDDLVSLAKLEAGKLELQPERLSLSLLVHELAESLESQARAKEVALLFASAETELEHDPDKLKQVLLHVLSCALRATPEAGSLQLQASRDADAHDQVRLQMTGGSTLAQACLAQLSDSALRSLLTQRLAEQLGVRICGEHSSVQIVLPRSVAGTSPPNRRPSRT